MERSYRVSEKWRCALVMAAIFALALLMRLYYVLHALGVIPIQGDAVQYFAYAWNLAHHGVFSMAHPGADVVVADSFRDPGYPLMLASLMLAIPDQGIWFGVVLLVQAALGAFTVLLAMLAGRTWLSLPALAGGGILMAVWPHSIAITSNVLSETLTAFLVTASVATLTAACRTTGPRAYAWTAAAGLLFAATALTNAVFAPVGPVVAIVLYFMQGKSSRTWAIMLACTLLPLMAWQIRAATLPSADSSSHRATMNFVQGSWPIYHDAYMLYSVGDPRGQAVLDAINVEYRTMLESPSKGLAMISRRMAQSPGTYMAWYAAKPWILWSWRIRLGNKDIYVFPVQRSPFQTDAAWRVVIAVCSAINPLVFVLAIGGIVATIRERRSIAAVVIAVVLLFCTAIYTVLQSEPRYGIPLRPCEFLMAATAISHGYSLFRKRSSGLAKSVTKFSFRK